MTRSSRLRRVLFVVLFLGVDSLPAMAQATRRYYGNMPFSIDVARGLPPQFHFTAQHIGQDSNLLVFHMDWFPIPWPEFASGAAPPHAWAAEIDRMVALQQELNLPVYLAVAPINGSRDRLAARAFGDGDTLIGDESFGAPCERISSRADIAALREGFHNYVDYLVGRFQPKFLALSFEVNIYEKRCPAAWADLEAFLNAEYDRQKEAHPELPIFHTYQVDFFWEADDRTSPCFGFRRDCLARNVSAVAGLKGDLFALSSYPVSAYVNNGRSLPEDYLTVFASLTGKRLAVAETGYPGATVSGLSAGQCIPGLPSSPEDQSWWMERLLSDAERMDMPFVVWWANQAALPFGSLGGCHCEDSSPSCGFLNLLPQDAQIALRFFILMALRDHDGTPQPALSRWTAVVARAHPREPIPPGPRRRSPRAIGARD